MLARQFLARLSGDDSFRARRRRSGGSRWTKPVRQVVLNWATVGGRRPVERRAGAGAVQRGDLPPDRRRRARKAVVPGPAKAAAQHRRGHRRRRHPASGDHRYRAPCRRRGVRREVHRGALLPQVSASAGVSRSYRNTSPDAVSDGNFIGHDRRHADRADLSAYHY